MTVSASPLLFEEEIVCKYPPEMVTLIEVLDYIYRHARLRNGYCPIYKREMHLNPHIFIISLNLSLFFFFSGLFEYW